MLGVTVDGVWGVETSSAYRYADANLRGRIDAILARERLSAYSVQRVTTSVKRPGVASPRGLASGGKRMSPVPAATPKTAVTRPNAYQAASGPPGNTASRLIGWYTEEQLSPVIYAAVAGLSNATYDRMIRKLKLEAAKQSVGGVMFYNARSVNGRYRGLFQMGRAAWADIEPRLGHSYDKVFDPAINARAAALYIENNVRVARVKGYKGPITDDVVYAMHNQGVGGFLRILNGGSIQGTQSKAAKAVIERATRTPV